VYDSFAAAVDAAELAGGAEEAQFCLVSSGAPEGEPHTESIFVDNTGQRLGDAVSLALMERPLCPDPASGIDEPAVRIATDSLVVVHGAELNMTPGGPCGGTTRPGVSTWGGGNVALSDSTINGARTYGVANGLDGLQVILTLQGSRVANTLGAAIHTRGPTGILDSEIAGNLADSESGVEAVVWAVPPTGTLDIRDSVFFGNVADGAEASATALVSGAHFVYGSAFIANGVTGGIPILQVGYTPLAYAWDGDAMSWDGFGVLNSVFSRNRQIASIQGMELPGVEPAPPFPAMTERCTGDFAATAYHDLESPVGDLEAGVGPIVRVDRQAVVSIDGEALFARSFFVSNETGGEAVIVAEGGGAGLKHVVLHNTFASNDARQLIRMEQGLQSGSTVVGLRNLVVDLPVDPEPMFSAAGAPEAVIVSMNIGPEGIAWVSAPQDPVAELLGPNVEVAGIEFEDPEMVRAASPCDRYALAAPGADEQECAALAAANDPLDCTLDEADGWIPTEVSTGTLPDWVWSTAFFDAGLHGWALRLPGATGWDPGDVRGTIDALDGGVTFGDLDWYPDAVDCDNEDPALYPRVPEHDGITSEYCEAPEGSCYVCPEGTNPPPQDDDDSSGEVDDDDSAALEGDDDDGGGGIQPGCASSGCGFAWSCDDGGVAVLPFLPLLLFRHQRRRGAGFEGVASPAQDHSGRRPTTPATRSLPKEPPHRGP